LLQHKNRIDPTSAYTESLENTAYNTEYYGVPRKMYSEWPHWVTYQPRLEWKIIPIHEIVELNEKNVFQ